MLSMSIVDTSPADQFSTFFQQRIWPGEGSTAQWKWSPPSPGSLKALLFPPLFNKVENKGTQGVRARYDTELPPIISIVRHPGRPVILVVDCRPQSPKRLEKVEERSQPSQKQPFLQLFAAFFDMIQPFLSAGARGPRNLFLSAFVGFRKGPKRLRHMASKCSKSQIASDLNSRSPNRKNFPQIAVSAGSNLTFKWRDLWFEPLFKSPLESQCRFPVQVVRTWAFLRRLTVSRIASVGPCLRGRT